MPGRVIVFHYLVITLSDDFAILYDHSTKNTARFFNDGSASAEVDICTHKLFIVLVLLAHISPVLMISFLYRGNCKTSAQNRTFGCDFLYKAFSRPKNPILCASLVIAC